MANAFNLDWESIESGNKNSVNFMKLEEGVKGNRVRIVGKPAKILTHWETDASGKSQRIVCPGAECPICHAGKKPSTRFQVVVIDKSNWNPDTGYANGEIPIKVLECGSTIIKQISQFAVNAEYGNPTKYDINIRREGKGLNTKYTILPSRTSSPLTEEEIEAVQGAPKLEEINKITTPEQIKEMHLVMFGGAEDGAEHPATNANAGGAGTEDAGWDSFE